MIRITPNNSADRRAPTRNQRRHRGVRLAASYAIAALVLASGGSVAKPARPEAPSWRGLTPSQNAPVRSLPRKKKPAAAGWRASTEPDTTASTHTEDGGMPLPQKNPFKPITTVSPASEQAPATTSAPMSTPATTTPSTQQKTSSRLNPAERLAPDEGLTPADVVSTEAANEAEKDKAKDQDTADQPPIAAPIGDGQASKQYCANISTAAADARFAWQKKALLQTEQEVAKRVAELDQKIAEYQKWLARRDEFSRKAEAVVVDIYAKMKPDAAAQQLTILDEEIAAAVLTKLTPRAASAVMNEMEPKRAARLTAIITGAAKGPGSKPPGATPPRTPNNSKDNGT